MSRHFSIPTALRMTPHDLLRQVLERLGHADLGVPWNGLAQREIGPIAAALERFSAASRAAVETVLQDIFDLACSAGLEAIREAQWDLLEQSPAPQTLEEGGPYGVAAWIWLHHPLVFQRASVLHQVDGLGRWRKRKDLPRVEPSHGAATLDDLSAALAELLRREQGRGGRCTVEHVRRGDGTDYFFAYPDDFAQVVTAHEEDGRLAPRTVRHTFEIVFAYNRHEGALETFARVPSRLKPSLEDLFSRIVLGNAPEAESREAAYDLDILKARCFELPTDPQDCQSARLNRVRLTFPNNRRNLILEANRAAPENDMPDMVRDCIHEERVSLDSVRVTAAQIHMQFPPVYGRRRNSLTFDVTYPDLCSLRNERSERAALAADYLRRWKIARA